METPRKPIARNLRRWRLTRGLTISALAERAGVAKSTVSLIERGRANPSIDTIWALASELNVPFASLFHDEPTDAELTVVRDDDGAIVAIDRAGKGQGGLIVRHMLTRSGGGAIEIYTLMLQEGAIRRSDGHFAGLFEHIVVAQGTVEIRTDVFAETLHPGDLISFRADRPHSYKALEGHVRLVSVHEYPRHRDAPAPTG